MIRFAWVALNIALATLFFGLIVLVAALFRVRGPIYSWCTQQWSRAILWASNTPVRVHGMDRVDWDQPQVLVSNHISGYDIFALASVVPAVFRFVGKKELDRIPFFGIVWRAAGHISLDRSNRSSAVQSLQLAGKKIRREGGTVIVFPEGTRSRSGEMLPFKKGAFILAREAKVPVVPAVVVGSNEIQAPGSLRVRPRPIDVFIGAPISSHPAETENLDSFAQQVRERMLEMQREGAPARSRRLEGSG